MVSFTTQPYHSKLGFKRLKLRLSIISVPIWPVWHIHIRHQPIDLHKLIIVYICDEIQQLTENRVQGLYYPKFFPEKIYLPCIKYKLPSKNPIEDGVEYIYYAESLHKYKRKELNDKVVITTGSEWIDGNRCQAMLTLQCDQPDEKIFYKIKAGFDIFFLGVTLLTLSSLWLNLSKVESYMRMNNHNAFVRSFNSGGEEYTVGHKEMFIFPR